MRSVSLLELAHVDLVDRAVLDDLVGGFLGNDAQPALHSCKRGFDVEILLRAVLVGPDLAHRLGAEDVAEDVGIDDRGWHGLRSQRMVEDADLGRATCRPLRARAHSAVIFASRTTLPHFWLSRSMYCASSSRVLGAGSRPCLASSAFTDGSLRTLRELAIPEIEQILGRLARRDERVPVGRLEAGVARLRNGGHAGHHRRALGASGRERARLAGIDVRGDRRGHAHVHVDASAEEVGHRGTAALVGDVEHVDAGALLEELAGEMPRAPHTRRRIGELAGLRFGERYEFRERLRRHARMDNDHVREHDAHRDWRDVALRIVGQVLDDMRAQPPSDRRR